MKRTAGVHLAALLTTSFLVIGLPSCGGGGGCSGPLCGDNGTGPTIDPPGAPSNVNVSVERNTANVTWSAGSGATSHRVEMSAPGESQRTQTVNSGTSTTITGLSGETTYTVRVVAINSAGETPSQSVQATTPSPDGDIRVSVVLDDEPLEDAYIQLLGPGGTEVLDEAETGAQGRVDFVGLEPGEYWIRFYATDFLATFVVSEREVDLAAFDQLTVTFSGDTDFPTIDPHVSVSPIAGTRSSRRVFLVDVPGAPGGVADPANVAVESVEAAVEAALRAAVKGESGAPSASAAISNTLTVELSGGQGDADLCAAALDGSQADCSAGGTNDEFLSFENPTPGTWVVVIDGYTGYINASMIVEVPSTAPTIANLDLDSRPDPTEQCEAGFQSDYHVLILDWRDVNGDVTLEGGATLDLAINGGDSRNWPPTEITADTPISGQVTFGVCFANPVTEDVDYAVSLFDDEGFGSNVISHTVSPGSSSVSPVPVPSGEGGSGHDVAAPPLR